MRNRRLLHLIWLTLLFLSLAAGLALMPLSSAVAQGPPPGRPEPPPGSPGAPPGRPLPPEIGQPPVGPSGRGEGSPAHPCSGVFGFVLNWGYRYQPKLPINLGGDGWQTQKLTDDNGYYAFDCLGVGVGLLNPALPPDLHALTTDVAIRLGYQPDFEVNLGIYSGEVAPSPEVSPELDLSPAYVLPGQTLTYTIRVVNTSGLPAASHPMEGVFITDLLPESLIPVRGASTLGATEVWGNLLTADIGELASGQAVTITVVASVRENTSPGTMITNRAYLVSRNHVAVQTGLVSVRVATPLAEGAAGSLPTLLSVTDGNRWGATGQIRICP